MRQLENCIYLWRRTGVKKEVLLGLVSSGKNVGKWVPLGRSIDEQSSPLAAAKEDLEELGVGGFTPKLGGLVTELGASGWQVVLFLYVVCVQLRKAPASNSFASEYRWFDVDEVKTLQTPQADARFDLNCILALDRFYEAEMKFDNEGRLTSVAPICYALTDPS